MAHPTRSIGVGRLQVNGPNSEQCDQLVAMYPDYLSALDYNRITFP